MKKDDRMKKVRSEKGESRLENLNCGGQGATRLHLTLDQFFSSSIKGRLFLAIFVHSLMHLLVNEEKDSVQAVSKG